MDCRQVIVKQAFEQFPDKKKKFKRHIAERLIQSTQTHSINNRNSSLKLSIINQKCSRDILNI